MAVPRGAWPVRAPCDGMESGGLARGASPDRVALQVPMDTAHEPDVSMRCGLLGPGKGCKSSPGGPGRGSAAIDARERCGARPVGRLETPSVRQFLRLDRVKRVATRHERARNGGSAARMARDGAVRLDLPPIEWSWEPGMEGDADRDRATPAGRVPPGRWRALPRWVPKG